MIKNHIFLLWTLLAVTVRGKIGYFWHISDIHYDMNYEVNGNERKNCWRTEGSNTKPSVGRFGNYNCDSPWALVESAARAMKAKHGENIEFVLWTGDGLSGTASGRSSERQVSALQNLTHLLSQTFSGQFVFPVLGHDDPGWNPGERLLYRDVAHFWRHWLPTEAIQTFSKGGYYTIEQKEKQLRIIALNTNLYTSPNDIEDPMNQWSWLEMVLAKSYRHKETVFIVGHMGPGADERQPDTVPLFLEQSARRYLKLVRKYSDIIVGQFFGHLHSDTFRVVYNERGRPVSWMMMTPSVSPHRPNTGSNNPALRLYKFVTKTGQVLDYTQYYLDLTTANQKDQGDWQQEYKLSSYYGLNNVSAQSLHELATSFKYSSGQLFDRYYHSNSVKYPGTGSCTDSCIHTHYCAITRLEFLEFRHCLDAAASALASTGFVFGTSSFYVVLALISALVT